MFSSANNLQHTAAPHAIFRVCGMLLWLGCLLSSGCMSYRVGNQTLYRSDVKTVFIPMIRNDSFRPDLGVRLTEAIQKQIELRTPYKIVTRESADSTLTCRITGDTKRVITETNTDEPRALEEIVNVEAVWIDRRGMVLMENRFLPPGETSLLFTRSVDFVPEAGQTLVSAQQRAIERLADIIVSQMEMRW
ncbi:MAG: hypothetical protein JNK90_16325 [Planctomycetaceae bacterium]|nr:hypothetical protein [Planctomycetaceae bacterium]